MDAQGLQQVVRSGGVTPAGRGHTRCSARGLPSQTTTPCSSQCWEKPWSMCAAAPLALAARRRTAAQQRVAQRHRGQPQTLSTTFSAASPLPKPTAVACYLPLNTMLPHIASCISRAACKGGEERARDCSACAGCCAALLRVAPLQQHQRQQPQHQDRDQDSKPLALLQAHLWQKQAAPWGAACRSPSCCGCAR